MKKMIVLGCLLAGSAQAQDFITRPGDTVLSATAMARDVVGRSHVFFDGGISFFSVSGTYTYTYPDGGIAYGSYTLQEDGVVCSVFTHGFSRCDQYVHDGTRLVLITADGTRFPIRENR